MTADLSSTGSPGESADNPAAQRRPRSSNHANRATPATSNKPAPAKSAKGAQPSNQAPSTRAQSNLTATTDPRSKTPPVDQRDENSREYVQVLDSDERLQRHIRVHEERRKTEWHHLAMNLVLLAAGLVAFVVCVAVFLAAVIVLLHVLPTLGTWSAVRIVVCAFLAAGGGVGIGTAGRTLTTRLRGRGRGF